MKVRLAYGTTGMEVTFPEEMQIDVVPAKPETPFPDPIGKIIEACHKPANTRPLEEILRNRPIGKICIVVSDSTRPIPSYIILKALTQILDEVKVPNSDVQILIATGLHRKSTPDEIKRMVGTEIIERFDVINHVAEDKTAVEYLGQNSYGNPIYINKIYVNASVKILTGYVEPHFFAGFAGGRKSIVPGIAGEETILANHSAKNIASPNARFGILKGNPIYEEAIESAKHPRLKPDFMINVCINPEHKITKVMAGTLQIYNELVKYQERLCFYPIKAYYDVVVTGNGGSPLDLNLYQAVKSMALGELGVKKGGAVISVNECRDGVGQPKFKELINMSMCAEEMFNKVTAGEIRCNDQWEIQALARVLIHCDIYVVSTMSPEELGNIGLKYAPTVEDALKLCQKKYGSTIRALVLPDGPSIIPKYIGRT